eukprot:Opistho-2@8277
MTAYLPANLLGLFQARPALPHLPPVDLLPYEKTLPPYIGVAPFIEKFEDPATAPAVARKESIEERRARKKKERDERNRAKLEKKTLRNTNPTRTLPPRRMRSRRFLCRALHTM